MTKWYTYICPVCEKTMDLSTPNAEYSHICTSTKPRPKRVLFKLLRGEAT